MSNIVSLYLITALICLCLGFILLIAFIIMTNKNKPMLISLIISLFIATFAYGGTGIGLKAKEDRANQKKQELTKYINETDDIVTVYINGIRYDRQAIDVDVILGKYTLDHIDAESDAIYLEE